jgi:GTPase Era involved in 16S rRNA processing
MGKIVPILRDISVLVADPIQQAVTLETGNTLMPGLGCTREAAFLLDCVTRIRQGIFKVLALGAFKTGKSTLLNALLGDTVFPASPLPTTAVMTELAYGECDEIVIYEKAKEHPYLVSWEEFRNYYTLLKAEIGAIDSRGHITSELQSIEYAQAESQHSFLANGVQLIDMPGLGANSDQASTAGRALKLPETALLFVLNAMNPFSEDVEGFLATAFRSRRHENVFFVINRMDQIKPAMVDALKQGVHDNLWRHFLDENHTFDHHLYARRVFFVSARTALEANMAKDRVKFEASGLPALERELEQFLTGNERFLRILEPLLQSLQTIVERAYQRIAEEKATLSTYGKLQTRNRLDMIESKLFELLTMAKMTVADQDSTAPQGATTEQSEQVSALPGISRKTKILQLDEADSIDIWVNTDNHLQFVERVAEKYVLPHHERAELLDSIKQIRNRRADPNLYMAVVGEFSSGKSTFINALLRQKLLKASVLPTTATAARIHYGAALDVSVLFKNQVKPLSFLEAPAQLWECIRSFQSQQQVKDGDIHEFIRLVTGEDAIASMIDDLVIYHPASFLENGIVIIDTPGTNSLSERHALVTYQLIQREADAAVVIIPGSLLSQSLKAFITNQLRPFLHRSLFVVTKMDTIPEDEQQEVIEHLYRSVINDVGIRRPIIMYQAAAQVALNVLGENKIVRSEIEHWKDQFITLEYTLWHHLQRERVVSIAERLIRLMTRLFGQLDRHLRELRDAHEKRRIDLDWRLNAYTSHLQSASESTIGRHRHELQDLNELRSLIESDLDEVERRREVLTQEQQKLAMTLM